MQSDGVLLQTPRDGIYKRIFKKLLDVFLSSLSILLLSPLLVGIAILVRIQLGSPVIFKQKRPGKAEKIFTLYKFRTMTDAKNDVGEWLPDEKRLTKFGEFLRSTSLDELPELFNILIGDMSIVGPRPLLIRDLVFMTSNQRQRHSVAPGLSGLAQINGRNCVLWEDKLANDIRYIENITFIGDLKIILKTFSIVFRRHGINSEGMATTEDLGDYLLRSGIVNADTYIMQMANAKRLLYPK